jgi:hypothetical protein
MMIRPATGSRFADMADPATRIDQPLRARPRPHRRLRLTAAAERFHEVNASRLSQAALRR